MNILNLPPELQIYIFSFLDAGDSTRLRLLYTCKTWARWSRFIFISPYKFSAEKCLAIHSRRVKKRESLTRQQSEDLDTQLSQLVEGFEQVIFQRNQRHGHLFNMDEIFFLLELDRFKDLERGVGHLLECGASFPVAFLVQFMNMWILNLHGLHIGRCIDPRPYVVFFNLLCHIWLSCTPFAPFNFHHTSTEYVRTDFVNLLAEAVMVGGCVYWFWCPYNGRSVEETEMIIMHNTAAFAFKVYCWRHALDGDLGIWNPYYNTPSYFSDMINRSISLRGNENRPIYINSDLSGVFTPQKESSRQPLPKWLIRIWIDVMKHLPLLNICSHFLLTRDSYYRDNQKYEREGILMISDMRIVDPGFVDDSFAVSILSSSLETFTSNIDRHVKLMDISSTTTINYLTSLTFLEALCLAKRSSLFLKFLALYPLVMERNVDFCLGLLASKRVRGKKEKLIMLLKDFKHTLSKRRDVHVQLVSLDVGIVSL